MLRQNRRLIAKVVPVRKILAAYIKTLLPNATDKPTRNDDDD
jgi:hypothetical protein